MKRRIAYICFLLALLLAGCRAWVVTELPTPTEGPPGPSGLTPFPPGVTPPPTLHEQRQIVLEWPAKVREKDSDIILLSLNHG